MAISHYGGVTLWFPNAHAAPEHLTWKGSHHGVSFSPDSQHVAFFGAQGSRGSIVIDGVEVKDQEYEILVSDGALVFDSSNVLHTLAARSINNGTELFRVEVEIQ